jgi:hypothetical protein
LTSTNFCYTTNKHFLFSTLSPSTTHHTVSASPRESLPHHIHSVLQRQYHVWLGRHSWYVASHPTSPAFTKLTLFTAFAADSDFTADGGFTADSGSNTAWAPDTTGADDGDPGYDGQNISKHAGDGGCRK